MTGQSVEAAFTWSTMAHPRLVLTNPQQLNKYLAQYDDFLTFRVVDGRRPGPPSPHPVIGDNLELSRASKILRGRSRVPNQYVYQVVSLMPI